MVGSGWSAGAEVAVEAPSAALTVAPALSAAEEEDGAGVDVLEFVIKSGPKRWMTIPESVG